MNQQEYIENKGIYTDVPGPIMNQNSYSNVDYWYGPYTSIQEACNVVNIGLRSLGLTVGVYVFMKDNEGTYIKNQDGTFTENPEVEGQKYRISDITEYQWKTGITDEDLKPKVEQFNLTIGTVGNTDIMADEGDIIQFHFTVEGRATVSKGIVYQVVNNREILVGEFTNIGKGNNTHTIQNPTQSGVYEYRIKVLDSSGAYATTVLEQEYLSYIVRYGGITTKFNFTNLNAIQIKNQYSVASRYFTCSIQIRDTSFNITGVYLCDEEDGSHLKESLQPYTTPARTTQSEVYTGNKYYFLPSEDTLSTFNDKNCYIVIEFTEDGIQQRRSQFLFTLLDVRSLSLQPESVTTNYYQGIPAYYSFQLLSGVENISTVITAAEDSDFSFETVTVQSYRRFSLKVVPKVVKNNARLKINYSFRYDNVETTGNFNLNIGNIVEVPQQNYYEPEEGSTTTLTKIINASSSDYDFIEDGQYVKTINAPVRNDKLAWAFILDMYCKINQTGVGNTKYLSIKYNNVEIAHITEEEILCSTIITDTPLNEWFQVGIGVNLEESITRNSQQVIAKYYCIYINGMAVKNIGIDSENVIAYNSSYNLSVEISNGIMVQKCFLYYKNNGNENIYPNTAINESIIYNNYKSHKQNFSEPLNLPILKLMKVTDSELNTQYFEDINHYIKVNGGNQLKHTTTFGAIGTEKALSMNVYDVSYESSTIESDATLFRQSVDIKKPAQKEYAVLCTGQYMSDGINLLENVIIEVHTQGTSTLVYSVPNFKFTFWKYNSDTGELEHFYPEFIQKADSEEFYHEYIYTAKCDYMDSSHLNNTPTCTYYNNLIQALINGNQITGSPSARNGGIDAIMGFPIIMEISDTATSMADYFTNIGSFMFNVDKTGESLGFEIEEDGQQLSCFSLEGTSNDKNSGASGRFDMPAEIKMEFDSNRVLIIPSLKSYISGGIINETEIDNDYNIAKDAIKNQTIEQSILTLPYVQWCNFFSQGLEYRYPDSDIYKEKSNKVSKIMNLSHFKQLYRMWIWVNTSDTLDQTTYKTQFVQYFDKYYCMLYFIQLMIFAQTDNLGKNAMFDCWDGQIWYPRPYDLDSQSGLDNNGFDNIATFVEIKPEFSLDYAPNLTQQQLEERYLTEESRITYNGQVYDRYHYSSENSKLWINFYKNFKSEIETFYANLRQNYNYSADSIIELCENKVINVLGTAQYNQDFQNKYLGNSDQRLAYGNRWSKFKKWMKRRFSFCDSYFNASEAAIYNLSQAVGDYLVQVDSPQYVTQRYQADSITNFVLSTTHFSAGSGAGTKATLIVNQDSVMESTLFRYVLLDRGPANYSNLMRLDVSNNLQITSISQLVGSQLNNLKYLNISSSGVKSLTVPSPLKTLIAQNVTLNSLTFADNCLVESIDLSGSTINDSIDFSMLSNLTSLNLSNCTFKGTATFANLPNLENITFTGTIFEGIISIQNGVNIHDFDFSNLMLKGISFSGVNLDIRTLNFTGTTFTDSTLNVNAISNNIRQLQFENCTGLRYIEITEGNSFNNLEVLGLRNSSIKALGIDNTKFEASSVLFPNGLASLYEKKPVNGTPTPFTFRQTVIEKISNINWDGTGANLFYGCLNLTEITGTITFTTNLDYTFYNCRILNTIPTINIDSSVKSAVYTFAVANALSYNSIAQIISSCTNVETFSNVCRCKQFPENQQINLNTLFGSNQTTVRTENNTLKGLVLDYAFEPNARGNNTLLSTTNKLVIVGKIPSNAISSAYMFMDNNTLTVPYDIFSAASNIKNASAMFAHIANAITFTAGSVALPTYTDSNSSQTVTLTNTVDKNFFPPSVENLMGIFYNTNVQIISGDIFDNLANLKNCSVVFGGRTKRCEVVVGNSTIAVPVNVMNAWLYTPNITTIAGCFSDIYNVYCTGLNFHSSLSKKSINMAGLFAISNSNYRSIQKISINIDTLTPIVSLGEPYPYPGVNTNTRGAFDCREVILQGTGSSMMQTLKRRCDAAFRNAILYIPNTVNTFDLQSVITSCNEMFLGCRLYALDNTPGYVYSDTDRYFVDVNMPNNCASYYRMFEGSSLLKNLPALKANTQQVSRMFFGCVINVNPLVLPFNYFQVCKTTLTSTSEMFRNNMYLRELEYNQDIGLFSGCVNLQNVTYMFAGTHYLHKGIPNNIFGTVELPRIASLNGMFYDSLILYNIENGSHKWVDSNTLYPLTNLVSVDSMFSRNKIWNPSTGYSTSITHKVENASGNLIYIIAPDTFIGKKLVTISNLFRNTPINIPFLFTAFEQGVEAFFNTAMTEIDATFVDSTYAGNITNITRMFYCSPNAQRTINNLGAFIEIVANQPLTIKTNIAGNLLNNDIEATYKGNDTTANGNLDNGMAHNTLENIIY